jgi:hypothetical protein
VSGVGGSDRIGFTRSGYDRKYVTTGVRSGTDWIGVIEYKNEDLFYSAIQQKWKNMEFLKAMLAAMNSSNCLF